MAGRRRIEFKERVGLAVNLDGLFGLNGARDDEGLVDGNVKERDFAVFRMNIGFHFSVFLVVDLSVALASLRTRRPERRSYGGHAPTCPTGKVAIMDKTGGKSKKNQRIFNLKCFPKLGLAKGVRPDRKSFSPIKTL